MAVRKGGLGKGLDSLISPSSSAKSSANSGKKEPEVKVVEKIVEKVTRKIDCFRKGSSDSLFETIYKVG